MIIKVSEKVILSTFFLFAILEIPASKTVCSYRAVNILPYFFFYILQAFSFDYH